MKKSDELKQEITAKKELLDKLEKEMKFADAVKAADEISALCDKLKIEQAKEKAEFENFLKNASPVNAPNTTDKKKLANRAFNKLLFGKWGELTDEERAAYYNVSGSPGQPGQIESINTKGGYLVPTEQFKTVLEFKKEFVQLKNSVSVVQANSNTGIWATFSPQDLIFQTFAEATDTTEGDMDFGKIEYTIQDKGLTIPVSKQLIQDADIDIISFVGRQLAQGAVNTENAAIVDKLNTYITGDTATSIAEATTMTSYKQLNTALLRTLDGAYLNAAKIITNQDGFLYLSNLEDAQNHPLIVPDVTAPSKYLYRGKEIIVVPNSTLSNTTISNQAYAPFFIGDFKSFLYFFERLGMELLYDSSIYFKKYAVALQGIIRFGVSVADPNAVTALKVAV